MIRSILLALVLAAGVSSFAPSAAQAQNARVVSGGCGSPPASLPANDASGLFIDSVGRLCVSGGAAETKAGSGGVASFSRIPSSAATNNLTLAKAGATRAYTYHACNTTASTVYLRLYNAASTGAVTVGTTAPLAGPYAFPANTCLQATTFAADIGLSFSAGLVYAFGTAPADTDATAIGAGAITAFQIGYQ
jgi:hypothetical protein